MYADADMGNPVGEAGQDAASRVARSGSAVVARGSHCHSVLMPLNVSLIPPSDKGEMSEALAEKSTEIGVEMLKSPQVSLERRSGGCWKLVAGDGQVAAGDAGEKLELDVPLAQAGESW
jgi:hypothetical protein